MEALLSIWGIVLVCHVAPTKAAYAFWAVNIQTYFLTKFLCWVLHNFQPIAHLKLIKIFFNWAVIPFIPITLKSNKYHVQMATQERDSIETQLLKSNHNTWILHNSFWVISSISNWSSSASLARLSLTTNLLTIAFYSYLFILSVQNSP